MVGDKVDKVVRGQIMGYFVGYGKDFGFYCKGILVYMQKIIGRIRKKLDMVVMVVDFEEGGWGIRMLGIEGRYIFYYIFFCFF